MPLLASLLLACSGDAPVEPDVPLTQPPGAEDAPRPISEEAGQQGALDPITLTDSDGPHDPALPTHIVPMPVPADNPQTLEGFTLGRALFYEAALSSDGSLSCASCHKQQHGFGDATPTSTGPGGVQTAVNTPPLVNLAWSKRLFWDGRAESIEAAITEHLADPTILATDPASLPSALAPHADAFEAAFPGEGVTAAGAVSALSQFVRALASFDAPIDRIASEEAQLSAQQERGAALLEERMGIPDGEHRCNSCHARGAGLQDTTTQHSGLFTSGERGSNGTGTWRVPTIRNVELTAPYFHDGSAATLSAVLGHYSALPETVGDALRDSDGEVVQPDFSEGDLADLASLLTLFTDTAFVTNPAYGAP